MAKLSECLKIHFGDPEDQYIVDMVKSRAKELSTKGRVSAAIAKKAVNDVIADFRADSDSMQAQLTIEPKVRTQSAKAQAPSTTEKVMPTYLGASAKGIDTPAQAEKLLAEGKSAEAVRKATG
jgi:hypothetical protein